ncbi:conserved hypothetical protein [Verticillium alfalfae VaMs.102]|uniref:Uncharacterized protein n=1 Tax=Verticillium alfalfae (strain VaMs.102 / ATCC MYA-4576 / FGSC 10136) TaxID=526221 RepID=C9SWG9_VERA1|nr:conserved hypothetical protein [Verticillium alfalfae VaMs.102]EEY23134.1 conserved hypothetical protein [Verticillium alfalfae VaMs.102]
MHYIRLLRPPALSTDQRGASSVHVVLTITTDLGDSFLSPEAPIKLKAGAYAASVDAKGGKPQPSDIKTSQILEWRPGTRRPHVSFRRLRIGSEEAPFFVQVEEDIGESIARHIWDAGVVATSILLENGTSSVNSGTVPKLTQVLASDGPLHIMELGCGVGILGLGIAALLSGPQRQSSQLLLTDLPEAEDRTQANIDCLASTLPSEAQKIPSFESLDWEDGRKGKFGPRVQDNFWHLIVLSDCTYNVDMLPALVGTLTALHDANKNHVPAGEIATTRVLLATKPRHESEKALFDLMSKGGWFVAEQDVLPLPVMGQEPESVEIYIFEQ